MRSRKPVFVLPYTDFPSSQTGFSTTIQFLPAQIFTKPSQPLRAVTLPRINGLLGQMKALGSGQKPLTPDKGHDKINPIS
jgi:hypothetical protein